MPQYHVTDPKTGKSVTLTGDSPPSEAELEQVFRSVRPTPAPSTAEDSRPAGMRYATNLVRGLNPLPALKYAVPGFGAKWLAEDMAGGAKGQAQQAMNAESVPEAIGHGAAAALPILGPAAAHVGEQLGRGDIAGGLGSATAMVFAPGLLRATGAGARLAGRTAVPLVRSAIKPTVTAMKRQPGASATGLEAQAKGLASWMLDRGIKTPEQAEALIRAREGQLQQTIQGVPTRAAQRADRYLAMRGNRPNLPPEVGSAFERGRRDLVNEPLGETVMVDQAATSPILAPTSNPRVGQPIQTTVQVPTRQLRETVPAQDALDMARQKGKWGNRKNWGEVKGVEREIEKTIERAERDAVKSAVPAARPLLRDEGMGIRAKEILDRMRFREGNRDAIGLPEHVIAAGELAAGKLPLKSILAGAWKRNQLNVGFGAHRLGRAGQILSQPELARLALLEALLAEGQQ